MTLYEMLDATLYYQDVCIYETNAYDQNIPIFKGTVSEARRSEDGVWNYLMCTVDHYECNIGTLLIKVKGEYYEERFEARYLNSDKWGTKESERPWKYDAEIKRNL